MKGNFSCERTDLHVLASGMGLPQPSQQNLLNISHSQPQRREILSVSPVWEKENTTGLCQSVTAVARDGASLCQHVVTELSQVTSSPALKRSQANLRGLNLLLKFLEPQGSAGSDAAAGLDVWVPSPG